MKINKNIIEQIQKIQLDKGIINNQLLLFAYMIHNAQLTVIKSIMSLDIILKEDMLDLFNVLAENELVGLDDIAFMEKITKTKKSNIDMVPCSGLSPQDVIDNINMINNTSIKLTKTREAYIVKLLKQGYKIEDLLMVNEYFDYKWSDNPDMSRYIRVETLYNNKFESRYEEAKSAYLEILKFQQDISVIYNEYVKTYKEELKFNLNDISDCNKKITFKDQERMVFWLKKGYNINDILLTINFSIKDWKKKIDLIPLISLSRILNDKFEDRQKIAQVKSKGLNKQESSLTFINDWISEGA